MKRILSEKPRGIYLFVVILSAQMIIFLGVNDFFYYVWHV